MAGMDGPLPDAGNGIEFVPDAAGRRSSASVGKAILAEALAVLDPASAERCLGERRWRQAYAQHVRRLVELQAAQPALTVASCRAGLDAAWSAVQFGRGGAALGLREAMATPGGPPWRTLRLRGEGNAAPARWEVPYQGRRLAGDSLARRIDAWWTGGIIEESHAQALHLARKHPEWFDLSDRHLVLLGAGSEAGPLGWLANWRANIVAVDLVRPPTWKRIAQRVRAGNATLIAPLAAANAPADDARDELAHAGCDLMSQAPAIAAWLGALGQPLDLATIAYADGEKHVRVTLAMDAIAATLCAADARTTLAWMATPTDVFAVPQALAEDVMRTYEDRGALKRWAQAGVRAGSGGRSFAPHIEALVDAADGQRWGLVDALVIEQGPNYALAKRMQQWRALVARAEGHVASINVAPSTTTASVLSNPALAAGFRGARAFDIEVFAPDTTNALMAALWVHDLRNAQSAAHPSVALAHPLQLLVQGANHGGLWRVPYLPRSVLPFAALLGLMKRR
ncbi:MAG: hypothetical protein ACRC2B_14190 [Rubrivivax sp.]